MLGRKSRLGPLIAAAIVVLTAAPLRAQEEERIGADSAAACDYSSVPGAVWWGPDTEMTYERLVSYMAPVYWFSPDEPLLGRTKGAAIRVPEALPFQEPAPDNPVVYYQIEELVTLPERLADATRVDTTDMNASILSLENTALLRIGYYAYFHSEAGLGAHDHDLEASEFMVAILRSDGPTLTRRSNLRCDQKYYVLAVTRVTAKAHGIKWFWNVLEVDDWTRFPMHLFVEEGKHALSTDKNSDGFFSPGYDVNVRVNDAWGVRDVIATGFVFAGGYQSYMTKPRTPLHRVWPPLPDDSPLIEEAVYERDVLNVGDDFVAYELRPLPPPELGAFDEHLHKFMKDKYVPGWPEKSQRRNLEGLSNWVEEGTAINSLSISLMYDGDLGFSFAFPFFIVKNLEDPFTGGWVVWRMYLKDEDLRDFGWNIMYTPSASRWIDSYFSAGILWDTSDCVNTNLGLDIDLPDNVVTLPSGCPVDPAPGETRTKAFFVLETGLKFRVNLGTSGIKPLLWLTEFWGLSFGIRNQGFPDINHLTYVIQFGAGVF